jgi:hypothetical protein
MKYLNDKKSKYTSFITNIERKKNCQGFLLVTTIEKENIFIG